MRKLIFGALLCPALLAAVPASAITRQKAVTQCRSIHAGADGLKRADRTGVPVAEQVKRCVRAKMKGGK